MTSGVFLGCGLGAALCLLVLALIPPRRGLKAQVARWQRLRVGHPAALDAVGRGAPADAVGRWRSRCGRWLVTELARRGLTLAKVRADLQLTDSTLESHLLRKCGYGLLGLLLPSVLTVVLAAGGVRLPVTLPAVVGLALACAFFWLPDLSVAQAAAQRRRDLRRALACYLDLVSMSLAGGRGIPEALPTAARIGTGWAFETLQDTIDGARYVGSTPWAALVELGRRIGMRELEDFGGALTLVADDGAKVRASLTARAASQRRRQLAEAEGAAANADQTIQMAQVVLAVGFVLFIGYPAVVAVMSV